MATAAYLEFERQLNSQGREYGQGFLESHFAGMTSEEKYLAAKALEAKAIRGDPVAINGVALMEPELAQPILLKVYNECRGYSSGSCEAAFALFQLIKDKKYFDYLVIGAKQGSPNIVWQCVHLLSQITNDDFASDLGNLWRYIVLENEDTVLRHIAAKRLLGEGDIVSESSRPTILNLISDDVDVRKSALSEL